jgi:hypothetical protein
MAALYGILLIDSCLVIPGPSQRARAKSRGPMTGSARSPESITTDRDYGFRTRRQSKSAVADLDIQMPISGLPEIGGDPE